MESDYEFALSCIKKRPMAETLQDDIRDDKIHIFVDGVGYETTDGMVFSTPEWAVKHQLELFDPPVCESCKIGGVAHDKN